MVRLETERRNIPSLCIISLSAIADLALNRGCSAGPETVAMSSTRTPQVRIASVRIADEDADLLQAKVAFTCR
ncbi:hypothetical protein BDW02DRAFT_564876 [Decorospora gaudefroyi]|uniref:Uncharacterized protein n=1 Tax=Decorospora gaudefroyi TaxID=184978 RepID=A0A6A5KVB0_9PLEO|nr:hypothetical protein BDW02DRAFT_564876 [Decorospora gaudefroyi]